jgi:hypothetical protein
VNRPKKEGVLVSIEPPPLSSLLIPAVQNSSLGLASASNSYCLLLIRKPAFIAFPLPTPYPAGATWRSKWPSAWDYRPSKSACEETFGCQLRFVLQVLFA